MGGKHEHAPGHEAADAGRHFRGEPAPRPVAKIGLAAQDLSGRLSVDADLLEAAPQTRVLREGERDHDARDDQGRRCLRVILRRLEERSAMAAVVPDQ